MTLIEICPECGSHRYEESVNYTHSPDCSRNTPEQLAILLKQYVEAWRVLESKDRKRSDYWQEQYAKQRHLTTHWQGKFRIVKHENNQLRKRLYTESPNVETKE